MTKNFFSKLRLLLLVTASLVVSLSVASCGDNDDSSAGADEIAVETGSLTKAQFVARADTVCRKSAEEIRNEIYRYLNANGIDVSSKDPFKGREAEIVETIAVPGFEGQIDQISHLGAPAGDEKEVTAILEAMSRAVEKGAEQPERFMQSGDRFGQAANLARAYGLTSCAQ